MLTLAQTRRDGRSIWLGCGCGAGRYHAEQPGQHEAQTVQALAQAGHFRCEGCGRRPTVMVMDRNVTPAMLERWSPAGEAA